MKIITIDECESTNTSLRCMAANDVWMQSGTTLRAVKQTAGRGQVGNRWLSEPERNLTFSMFLRPGAIDASQHFLFSECIATSIALTLQAYVAPGNADIKIKWPNDILADGKKIAGILIENTLDVHGKLLYSIVGIGININQTEFPPELPDATSLTLITGETYDLNTLVRVFAANIDLSVQRLMPDIYENSVMGKVHLPLEDLYHGLLWRRKGYHSWIDTITGRRFEARIDGIRQNGQMVLCEKDGTIHPYFFKEVAPL